MKRIVAIIIALITLIGINNNTTSNPTENAEPISTVAEKVAEETKIESSETVATPTATEIAETEPTVHETKQETTVKAPKETHSETPKQETGGITIGNPTQEQTYSCGVLGHHCAGPETHALLMEMADKGCDYCGSHSCPSFYAVDEWGQGCYDPTKCPKYNVQHDPCYYCQDCGKPCGDGLGGTCAVYNIDIACPNCGEYVKAWTCHSCK